jgi:hypothetical protein
MGNHDFGSYDPFFTDADKENNVLLLNKFITSSGYKVLNDESKIVNIGNSRIEMAGVMTKGSFPKIIFGNLSKAISGSDSADLNGKKRLPGKQISILLYQGIHMECSSEFLRKHSHGARHVISIRNGTDFTGKVNNILLSTAVLVYWVFHSGYGCLLK